MFRIHSPDLSQIHLNHNLNRIRNLLNTTIQKIKVEALEENDNPESPTRKRNDSNTQE
mgnify:CR=1 FL=1